MNFKTSTLLAWLMVSVGSMMLAQSTLTLPITEELRIPYDKGTRNLDGTPSDTYWRNYALRLSCFQIHGK